MLRKPQNITVHGIRVIENDKGRFVAMPSTPYTDKDGKKQYNDTFHPITKGARDALNQSVLNAYEIKLQQEQSTEFEVEQTNDETEDLAEKPEP